MELVGHFGESCKYHDVTIDLYPVDDSDPDPEPEPTPPPPPPPAPTFYLYIDPNGGRYNGSSYTTTKGPYEEGDTTYLSTPSRPGYRFTGWSISNYRCSISGSRYRQGYGNCTLTANWKKLYTLYVDPNGGIYEGSRSTVTRGPFDNGDTYTLSTPTRTGYNFTGWAISNSNCSVSGSRYRQGTGNCTLTAKWEPKIVTIYMDNDFPPDPPAPDIPEDAESGTPVPDPIEIVSVAGLPQIYEQYATKYMESRNGSSIRSVSKVPSKTFFDFEGYYTKRNGQGQKIIDSDGDILVSNTNFTEDTVIYACWKEAEYTLTVDPAGGVWQNGKFKYLSAHTFEMHGNEIMHILDPKREGYVFDGWDITNDDPDAGSYMVSKIYIQGATNTTITARWRKITFGYLRFIEPQYMRTLEPGSVWRQGQLNSLLRNTMAEADEDTSSCEQVWKFKAEDFEAIHQWCLSHEKGSGTDRNFAARFGANRIK